MANVIRFQNSLLKRVLPLVRPRRFIQQSSQKKTTVAPTAAGDGKCDIDKVVNKNWISYGFDVKSYEGDRNALHSIFFISVTVCMVFGGFFLAYVPDYNLRDWATREAFLELKRREECGLPLIDPNLIDPAKIKLPDDDDLECVEIII